jgi:hypothetical protein
LARFGISEGRITELLMAKALYAIARKIVAEREKEKLARIPDLSRSY